MSQFSVTIPIGNRIPGEYLHDLHESIAVLKMLVFERRELSIEETECHALYILSDLQMRLVTNSGTPTTDMVPC
jgi:hypothetical protein